MSIAVSRSRSRSNRLRSRSLGNLRRQVAVTGDEDLRALAEELVGYATELGVAVPPPHEGSRAIAVPMRVRTDDGELATAQARLA